MFHHPQLDPKFTIAPVKSGHSQQFSTHICTNDRSARAVHLRSMPRQALLGQGVHGGSGVDCEPMGPHIYAVRAQAGIRFYKSSMQVHFFACPNTINITG